MHTCLAVNADITDAPSLQPLQMQNDDDEAEPMDSDDSPAAAMLLSLTKPPAPAQPRSPAAAERVASLHAWECLTPEPEELTFSDSEDVQRMWREVVIGEDFAERRLARRRAHLRRIHPRTRSLTRARHTSYLHHNRLRTLHLQTEMSILCTGMVAPPPPKLHTAGFDAK